jgi:DNA-binding LacI/PurR family transcriptional regulator
VKRPTISDIARRAGVTKAAVSFALNGQPGVSATTRERILAIAEEIGFEPNSAARALSDGRAGAYGLVIDRPARLLGMEPFFMQLISGIQAELSGGQTALLFTTAEDQAAEIAMYRSWWAQRRVDGVFLVDLQIGDQRVPVLEELRMPAVVIGAPVGAGSLTAVWEDDAAATHAVVEHLTGLGHIRLARVTGIPRFWHTKIRTDAFKAAAAAAGAEAVCVEADYTGEHGAAATRRLLRSKRPPTAILYDNDIMAVSGLSAATAMGVDVPGELSIVAWDDSPLCALVHPPLAALTRDIAAYGAHAARTLIQLADGVTVDNVEAAPPVLTARGSTASPPQRSAAHAS